MSTTASSSSPLATLPSFLRRRNDRLELVLHCTQVQCYNICPRKHWLTYGEMVEASGPRPALNYGGAVHEALASRYSHLDLSLAEAEVMQVDRLSRWFAAKPQPSDEWRNAARAQDLIRAYNAQYPAHDWQVLAVEEQFEQEVGHVILSSDSAMITNYRAPITVLLAGRKDLVVAWHDGLWVVDHKTATEWGSGESNSHLDEGRRSFQFRGYAWAEREAQKERQIAKVNSIAGIQRDTLPILGTVGNYLISRKPYAEGYKPRAGGPPRNQFHQEAYPFDSTVLDEWRSECLLVATDILRDWQRGQWRASDSGCGHWGRCEFYDYCEEVPSRRADLLNSSLYQPRQVSDPAI